MVESYGAFLMKKARKILSEEASRTEPFTNSLLDGIDVRETIRNWHEGKIYVREFQPIRGRVGAVVVIFDPDEGPKEKFPWTLTWQGEHEQERERSHAGHCRPACKIAEHPSVAPPGLVDLIDGRSRG